MATIRNNNPTFLTLLAFWNKHCKIDESHIHWLKMNIELIEHLPKGKTVYIEGDRQKSLYFVSRGILARIRYDDKFKIHILSLAFPTMALMSTSHLYSNTASPGNIIALHANTSIIKISYSSIKETRQSIPEVATLVSILNNKKKKQLLQLRILTSIKNPIERYLYFSEHLQEVKNDLTHKEVAQLLGISTNSIFRASIKWRNR